VAEGFSAASFLVLDCSSWKFNYFLHLKVSPLEILWVLMCMFLKVCLLYAMLACLDFENVIFYEKIDPFESQPYFSNAEFLFDRKNDPTIKLPILIFKLLDKLGVIC
jgi:hypothetical protein